VQGVETLASLNGSALAALLGTRRNLPHSRSREGEMPQLGSGPKPCRLGLQVEESLSSCKFDETSQSSSCEEMIQKETC